MNKKDLRGIDKVIKQRNATIILSMKKRNVRELKVVLEGEEQDIVYTGCSLNDLLKKASKYLLANETQKQQYIDGFGNIEDGLDWLLSKKFNVSIIQEKDVYDLFTVKVKSKKEELHSISVFQVEGVFSALQKVDEWAKLIQTHTSATVAQ